MANQRIITLGFLLILTWIGMTARTFYVQVWKSDFYQGIAYRQSIRRNVLAPRRGEILDRNLKKLIVNAEFPVTPENGKGETALHRVCPNGPLAGQVLGQVGRDGYGQLGLEYFLDRELRGTDGWKYLRYDARNRPSPGFQDKQKEAVDGYDAVLTLDANMQSIAERALERGVLRSGAKQGLALIVDPFNGDILALANYPFYNPNTRENVNEDAWKNQAVAKTYEPGSTFKIITAAALIEEKRIRPEDTIDGENGTYKLMGELISDTHAHGRISFRDALAYSSNICFAKAVTRISPETFYRYIRSFGFGMKTAIGLPAEESGYLKSIQSWSGRTQSTMAFGHEIAVTPLQVAMACAAVANGGTLMKPRIIKAWADEGGNIRAEVPVKRVRRVISEQTAAQLRSMMGSVVEYGTAMDIKSDRISMAGKTGTAEKIDPITHHYVHGKFNSSFVGMVPVDKPQYVCLVLFDEPSLLKYGGQSAAPVFREIVDRLLAEPNYALAQFANSKTASTNELDKTGDSARVPNLIGYSSSDAANRLSQKGFTFRIEGKGDVVLAQNLPPERKILLRDTLVLSMGYFNSKSMPDLNNLTLREALLKLKYLNVDVEYQGSGKVIKQEPAIGSPVVPGHKCILTLGWMG